MDCELRKINGVVSMDKSFDYLCSRLRNGTYTLSIRRKTKQRSLSQNALMWMWFACLEDNSGQCKEDWHDYYCYKFLLRNISICGKAISVVGKTSQLTTEQFSEFLDKVQADAASEWGVQLPAPGDRFFEEFADEYHL